MKEETKILILLEKIKNLELQNEQLLAQFNKASEVTNTKVSAMKEVSDIVNNQGRFGRFTKLKALLKK